MLVYLGVYGFAEMVIFVSILAVGLIYAWMKGPSNGCNAAVQRA
jgi:NADH:ubiquinone oxidoreductase subunit 3 (subunit A)